MFMTLYCQPNARFFKATVVMHHGNQESFMTLN